MKFRREYLNGGFNGKTDEDDFVIGYQAENGMYIKNEFGWGVNYPVGYKVYKSREEYAKDRFDKDGVECYKLKKAREYCEQFA